ncbi:MAG: pimeloyl-ACP methyl ester carboxylesterase [Hydrogenophaga sp.]|jgi:pimeloyl-ACP methyl ester carboxylesterase
MNPLSYPWGHPWRTVVCAIAIASLAACGGGGDDETPSVPAPPPAIPETSPQAPSTPINPTGRGEFLQGTPLITIAPAEIAAALAADGSRVQNVVPRYEVATWRVEYNTLDADGQLVRASGLVAVPQKPAGMDSPVLSYQHGTIFRDAEAPSNNAVPGEVSVVLASLGYIVLASDYVGFGTSRGTPHPYLLAAPMAAAVNDFITATQYWRTTSQIKDNGELFLTGYSEGAYATLAAHRALQADNAPALRHLRMSVVGAGPYDVQATLDGLMDLVRKEQPILGALVDPGFLRFLGSSVRRDIRRALLRELLPDDADVVYDARFLDSFLADDKRAIAQDNSVYDWRPQVPVTLFHGRADRTVPYVSSERTLEAMKRNGAGDDQVSLTDCRAVPTGHLECVAPFIAFLLDRIEPKASGL